MQKLVERFKEMETDSSIKTMGLFEFQQWERTKEWQQWHRLQSVVSSETWCKLQHRNIALVVELFITSLWRSYRHKRGL